MTSVKVAVRVRPFNSREKAANSVSIIRMEGADTYIRNPVSKTHFAKQYSVDNLCVATRRTGKRKSLVSITATGAMMASMSQSTRGST